MAKEWGGREKEKEREEPNGYTMQCVHHYKTNGIQVNILSKNLLDELSLFSHVSRKQILNPLASFIHTNTNKETKRNTLLSFNVYAIQFASIHTQTLSHIYHCNHNLWYLFFSQWWFLSILMFFIQYFSRDFFYSILMIYAMLTAQTYAFQLECYWFIVTCTRSQSERERERRN